MATNLIASKSLSATTRNNEAEGHGLQITVGGSDIFVTALGRNFVTGNSNTHRQFIMQSISGVNVLLGWVDLAMSGGSNGNFKYATLPVPIRLYASTTYYILSDEANGGDLWLDYTSTLTPTSAATINKGGLFTSGSLASFGSSGNGYVPVDLQYETTDPTPGFTAYVSSLSTTGTNRTSFSDYIGFKFYAARAVTVYSFGRWVVSSNSQTHTMYLVNSSNSTLGSATVNLSGAPAGAFKYSADLASPVTLSAGSYYYIYCTENSTDHFLDDDTRVIVQPEIGYGISSVWSNNIGGAPNVHLNAAVTAQLAMPMYGPLDFRITAGGVIPTSIKSRRTLGDLGTRMGSRRAA